jgi:hypothetical protein
MRLPRMTTRRWMVAVAAVALSMGVTLSITRLQRRYRRFTERMRQHESTAIFYKSVARGQPDLAIRRTLDREVDRQVALASKYRYAARYPWLPVEPDPPEPE